MIEIPFKITYRPDIIEKDSCDRVKIIKNERQQLLELIDNLCIYYSVEDR